MKQIIGNDEEFNVLNNIVWPDSVSEQNRFCRHSAENYNWSFEYIKKEMMFLVYIDVLNTADL